jgi:hypothetical protein
MTPTLAGRLQTRLFLILVVGVPWNLLVSPVLPVPAGTTLATVYRLTLSALAIVTVLGFVWDAVYYGLQQFRWDKDWPSILGLLTVVNEGVTTWIGLHVVRVLGGSYGPSNPMFGTFVLDLTTTWLLIWVATQGPMRILFLRWRFRGARIV